MTVERSTGGVLATVLMTLFVVAAIFVSIIGVRVATDKAMMDRVMFHLIAMAWVFGFLSLIAVIVLLVGLALVWYRHVLSAREHDRQTSAQIAETARVQAATYAMTRTMNPLLPIMGGALGAGIDTGRVIHDVGRDGELLEG